MSDQLSADLASLKIDRGSPDRDPDRKSPLRTVVVVAVLIGLGVAAYALVVPRMRSTLFKTEVTVTEVALVSPAQASVQMTSAGYVVPQTVSRVTAKVAGLVKEVRVKQGDVVKAGDVLMVLDATDRRAEIAAARSRVATAQAQAQTARANLSEAEVQAKRARQLATEGVGPSGTADDLDQRVGSLAASVKAADANVRAAQAEVHALEVNLDSYTLLAPIGGTVISKPPEVGEMSGPMMTGIGTAEGTMEIADFTTLAVETDVPEARLHMIAVGGPAEIVLDAFPTKRFRGETLDIVPRVDRAKATVMVKVKFIDAAEGVLPDMSARVSFLTAALDPGALEEPPKKIVPADAVADVGGAKVVYVLDGDRVRVRTVELGPAFGDGFELVGGPDPGTKIVKSPSADLADGQKVKERTD